MRSATDFLPLSISLFMNRVRVRLPYLGSGGTSRFITRARRGMESPIERTSLVEAVQRTTANTVFVQVPRWLSGLYYLLSKQAQYVSALRPPLKWLQLSGGSLGSFRSVLGSPLFAVLDAASVERDAHDEASHA